MNETAKRGLPPDVAADRKKQILKAAVEVFAERGFHRTRVSDIAKRAGVAYGLIYHYFDSKDDVLNSLFQENWAVFLKVVRDLGDSRELDAPAKLEAIAALLIDALQVAPAIIQVIIQEISRSDRFVHPNKVAAFNDAFALVEQIIESGKREGSIKPRIHPTVGAYIFFGAIETVCTGFTLGAIRCSTKEEAEVVKQTFKQILLEGLKA
jgi:TetR/AcrR family transcriptional regulator, fatty acid metabolism regulator protein